MTPHTATLQLVLDQLCAKHYSPVGRNGDKNNLNSLKNNAILLQRTEVSKGFSTLYITNLKLSSQCLISHREDAHMIDFLRAADVACD